MVHDFDNSGLLFVLSGPCGSGKTSLAREWAKKDLGLITCRSITTRKPREAQDLHSYQHVSETKFIDLVNQGYFAEWIHPLNNVYYGTPKGFLEEKMTEGTDVVLEFVPEGYLNIKRRYPQNTIGIFVVPPTFDLLKERLANRNTETADEQNSRLEMAKQDMSYISDHDYLLINDTFEDALEQLVAIRLVERLRTLRCENKISQFKVHISPSLIRYYSNWNLENNRHVRLSDDSIHNEGKHG